MRLRADRFFSDVSYQRMVAALTQITTIPNQGVTGKKTTNTIPTATGIDKNEPKNNNNNNNMILMDQVLREAILSTHAFTDIHSPLYRDPEVCDLEQLSNKLAKPPMANSHKLAKEVVKYMYMKSNKGGIFPNFNAPQLAATEAALTRRMTMIQGPPGSGKTTVAAAIGFGFVHQCRTISNTNSAKVLACAFSNVGADNLAEAMIRLGLKVVRIGKPSAVTEALWNCTLDAAIDRDETAQKAIQNAARATARLSKCSKGNNSPSSSSTTTTGGGALGERSLREAATLAVKASIQVRQNK
jgi:hypothetical protein